MAQTAQLRRVDSIVSEAQRVFALQRKAQFEEEFDRLVAALADATGPGPSESEREKVGTR